MPNTGKASQGCHLCRARRVKCDARRPGCLKCSQRGVPCPGYRDQQDLIFRNQTPGSIRQKTQPAALQIGQHADSSSSHSAAGQPPQTQAPHDDAGTGPASPSASFTLPHRDRNILPDDRGALLVSQRCLGDEWKSHSVPLMMEALMPTRSEGDRDLGQAGMGRFLPDLYKTAKEDSCLILTTHLFTRAYIARHTGSDDDILQQVRYYGLALRSTKATLERPANGFTDEFVASIWLLSIYEILVGSRQHSLYCRPPKAWHHHLCGLTAVLRQRGDGQFSTTTSRSLFFLTYSCIQVACLAANMSCPPDSFEWLQALGTELDNYEKVQFALVKYGDAISTLCHRLDHAIVSKNIDEMRGLYASVMDDVESIEALLPPTIFARELRDKRFESLPQTFLWIWWSCSTGRMHQFVLKFLDQFEPVMPTEEIILQERRRGTAAKAEEMTRLTMEAVPYVLTGFVFQGKLPSENAQRWEYWGQELRLTWPRILVLLLDDVSASLSKMPEQPTVLHHSVQPSMQ